MAAWRDAIHVEAVETRLGEGLRDIAHGRVALIVGLGRAGSRRWRKMHRRVHSEPVGRLSPMAKP